MPSTSAMSSGNEIRGTSFHQSVKPDNYTVKPSTSGQCVMTWSLYIEARVGQSHNVLARFLEKSISECVGNAICSAWFILAMPLAALIIQYRLIRF